MWLILTDHTRFREAPYKTMVHFLCETFEDYVDIADYVAGLAEACDVAIFAGNLAESAVITINCSLKGIENHCDTSRTARQIAEKLGGKGGGSPTFGMVNLPRRLEFSGFGFSGLF
jgi:alanyl-tRNA synthetase